MAKITAKQLKEWRQRLAEQQDKQNQAMRKALRELKRADEAGDPYEQARIVQGVARTLKAAGLDYQQAQKCMQALAMAADQWEKGTKQLDALHDKLKRDVG